ncbi:MAG: glycosyltransferase family A protein [Acidiphilium sp.]|nr:glycosyltransferase family A protein [Acidiphilium sp.]MDD4935922.1 glycosyltransferase family A protein [Acidiphilium sp.]
MGGWRALPNPGKAVMLGAVTNSRNAEKFGVVIPYFQRNPGLLAQAVRSVFAQAGAGASIIVIVDDGSPLPARAELAPFSIEERAHIVLIEQRNAGVSAARNRALDAMPEEIGAIAFLDPDDVWEAGHLANAAAAFRAGAQFYFSDHIRDGEAQTRFAKCAFDVTAHPTLDAGIEIHRFAGDFVSQLVRMPPVGTSTVVIARAICQKKRFRNDLSASEDLLFWISTTRGVAPITVSARCEARYYEGVGLIEKAGWGTRRSLRVALDQDQMLAAVMREVAVSDELEAYIKETRRGMITSYARTLLHRARRGQSIDIGTTVRFAVRHPSVIAACAQVMLRRRTSGPK